MNLLWGGLIVAAGLFLLICGTLRSDFVIYRFLVARSKMLWGKNVYRFHQIAGGAVVVFGIVMALGLI